MPHCPLCGERLVADQRHECPPSPGQRAALDPPAEQESLAIGPVDAEQAARDAEVIGEQVGRPTGIPRHDGG
jgi:hypothetical protein